MPNQASISLRATRLFCTAAMTLVVCACPAVASAASAGDSHQAVAHGAQSQQAQARALRRQEREARKQEHQTRKRERQVRKQERQAARQAQRSARQAEREQRQASRASQRAERAGAAGELAGPPAQNEVAAPEGASPTPKGAGEAQPLNTGHRQCSLTAEASSAQVALGESVTISGKLSCPTAAEAGEQQVTVYSRETDVSGSALTPWGTVTTAPDGSYSLPSAPLNGRTVFYVRSANVLHAARVAVLVDGAVTLQGPVASGASLPMGAGKTAGGPAKAAFSGTIRPEEAGRQVALQVRYGNGEWRTVAFTRTDAAGRFQFSHRFSFAGNVSVMAAARPRGTVHTQSPTLTYTITQVQNPTLTIQRSVAPTALAVTPGAGAQTTITGVATGHPNQTVTLLSRTDSPDFTSVATVQSDSTGAYTFTVEPTQTTIYKVACGRGRSTQLLVEAG
ncbi:MAG TPA: hypothetical protein VHT25_09785 [Solirubrobacteraceae bacterium]|nr:hypothetical protein [Solirubrobacteraceae bacterium]